MREIGSFARHGLAPCHSFAVRYVLFRPGGRGGAIATVTVIWVIGGVGLAANLLGEPDLVPLWFLLPWLCGAVVAGYMTLFRRAAELRIDDDMVTAVYGFRSCRVGVSSLTRIRPGRGGGNVVVIEVRGESPIIGRSAFAVADFADALQATGAGLPIDVGWRVDLDEQLGRPSRS